MPKEKEVKKVEETMTEESEVAEQPSEAVEPLGIGPQLQWPASGGG